MSSSKKDVNQVEEKIDPINIELDDLWLQLKEITLVRDSSTSLKFKWISSQLEANFFSSVDLKRRLKVNDVNFSKVN